ncbi:MAG: ankyrin repeat domain-containing protein [Gammaproteobacteria bacterium]
MRPQRGLLPFEDLRLHMAALKGDLFTAKKLLQQGFNVHMRDIYSSTPLHLAAFNGHLEMAELLVQAGAKVDSESYINITPLFLAIQNHHPQMVMFLLKAGANPNFIMREVGTPYALLLNMIFDELEVLSSYPETNTDRIFNQIEMLKYLGDPEYGEPIINGAGEGSYLASVLMSVMASKAHVTDLQEKILNACEAILIPDLHQLYLEIKNLLHSFNMSSSYTVEVPHYGILNIKSEGHWSNWTTELARSSITDFLREVDIAPKSGFKYSIFESIESILKYSDYLSKNNSEDVASDVYKRYQAGEMVLLPTGWDGHFVAFLLHDNYLIVCNSGLRFQTKISGATMYEITQPEALTSNMILDILNNHDQTDLEYNLHYTLGLNPIYNLEFPNQEIGNCAWYSFLPAIKSMIFLKVSEMGIDMPHAETITEDYFRDWYEFHKTWILDHYLENHANANFDILMDIFIKEATSYDDEPNPRLDTLFEVLSGPFYQDKFADFVQTQPIVWMGLDDALSERGLDLHTGRKAILDIHEVLDYNQVGLIDDKVQLMVPPYLPISDWIVEQGGAVEL